MVTSRFAWVISLTSRSQTSYAIPLRSETSTAQAYASFSQSCYKKSGTHVYTSFFQLLIRRKLLTQHVREMTSEVSEQDVGEATRRRNDRNPNEQQEHLFEIPNVGGGSR